MDTKSLRSKALFEFVQLILSDSKVQDSAYDLDHVMRVWKIGMQIGETEKANLEILEPALLFHDIVRPASFLDEGGERPKSSKIVLRKTKSKDHGSESAALSRKILPDFCYKDDEIEKIAHAIESHTSDKKTNPPQTLEAKIVYDADFYDTLGFSGCARTALFCAREKMTTSKMAEWYLMRIKNMLRGAPFYTRSAVNLSNERLTVSLDFCKELLGKERFEAIMKR